MGINIANHRLKLESAEKLSYVRSPNISGTMEPKYLVIHYTAGASFDAAVSWLADKKSQASVHAVIGRDGSITQMVPFNRVAWHAGPSEWDGIHGLSAHSIGFELDNAGRLKRVGNSWVSWFGRTYPDDEVLVAAHKFEPSEYGWHTYTEAQIAAALDLGVAIFDKYDLIDVIGHDDIAPLRKWDPGPAFPMHSFRSKIVGRKADVLPVLKTSRALHLRSGPGFEYRKVLLNPLPKHAKVEVLRREGSWYLVDVLDEVEDEMDIQGWVHARHLQTMDE